ncbi:MAG: HAMP domain-containing histidine kinase [Pseudomonadota bacterium]|nr:HAMP domain-containing histidine kinase [Pseudomonadota bacterium]
MKIPLVVAALMIAVSAMITNRVLERVAQTQENHLEQLADSYLDGLATSILPFVIREDVWEVFDALDRAKERHEGLDLGWTTVTNADGKILASSRPTEFESFGALPADILSRFPLGQAMSLQQDEETAYIRRGLVHQDRTIGSIYTSIGITALNKERSEVLLTLLATNSVLTLLMAALGYFTVRRMVLPIKILSQHLDPGRRGRVEAIPDRYLDAHGSEFSRLFRRFNGMVGRVNERELLANKLSEEEKLASLGRLASGIAHEINNPLGGMFNALDALKRHGGRESVRQTSLRLIEQGLSGIRDLVRSTLVTYRADRSESVLPPRDLDDLRLLVRPEVKRKGLDLQWTNDIAEELPVPAGAVRDAVLNLLLNACAASPEGGAVTFAARRQHDRLVVEITDEGLGLPANVRQYLEQPDIGSAPIDQRGGLGLWMVKRLATENGGELTATDHGDSGTKVSFIIMLRKRELGNAA